MGKWKGRMEEKFLRKKETNNVMWMSDNDKILNLLVKHSNRFSAKKDASLNWTEINVSAIFEIQWEKKNRNSELLLLTKKSHNMLLYINNTTRKLIFNGLLHRYKVKKNCS